MALLPLQLTHQLLLSNQCEISKGQVVEEVVMVHRLAIRIAHQGKTEAVQEEK